MDAEEARAYLKRWQEVEKIQQIEAQNTSFQERWRQLNALKLRALRLGITRKNDGGETDGFLLWAKLRKTYVPS